ncbi:MAG: copper homeostasis periplasmic binding protein CopC [Sphingomonadales bacterium]|nr:copper homeostasis periplasmic binding protein CopC [Sphingomonadales bacterium]
MSSAFFFLRGLIIPVVLLVAGPAFAHASLVQSTPAADATVSKVQSLTLTFSEQIDGKLSGVDIVMTGMPGMANHAPMKVTGFKTSLSADGKTMTLTLPRALPAGTYKLSWHAVTGDGHRMEGGYNFGVK